MASKALAQQPDFVCGTVDRVADHDQNMALDRYSADAAFDRALIDATVRDFSLTPYGTANFGHRWRRNDGLTPNTGIITLGVHYVNASTAQQQIVERAAANWLAGELGSKLAFRHGVDRQSAQISVMFGSEGNNSVVGRASADYARSQATMNLQDLVDYVIIHEFGHAIGLQHEHQNPGMTIEWNKPVVISEMAKQSWTPQMCESNIFSRYSQNYACGSFDSKSIMLYPIPQRWTLNGFSSGTNTAISEGDKACMTAIYRV